MFWSLKFILSKCTPSTVAYRTYMSSENACSAFCRSYISVIFHLKLSYSPAYFRFCKTTYSQNAFLSDLKTKTANFKIGVGFVSRSVQNVRRRRRFITICPLKIIFPRDFQFLYFLMIIHSFIRLIFFSILILYLISKHNLKAINKPSVSQVLPSCVTSINWIRTLSYASSYIICSSK